MFLRQTTSQVVRIGPFLDSTNGVDPEAGLTIANTDIQLSKDGAGFANKASGGAAADGANGWYSMTLSTGDTGTVGELIAEVTIAGALPVWFRWWVLEEPIYDALFGASAAGFDANQRVDVGGWLGTAVTVSSTSGKPEVDVFSISDDATAADNAELGWDNTGVSGDNLPATQGQVSQIGSGGGSATNEFPILSPNGFVLTTGSNEVNNEDATRASGGDVHQISDNGGTLDVYYIMEIGGAFSPNTIVFDGRMNGNNDDVGVYVNTNTQASPTWVLRATLEGSNSSINLPHVWPLINTDQMVGADAGKVAVRFQGTGLGSATLTTDQILVEKTTIASVTGYQDGQIWVNTLTGTAGTVPNVNGVADKASLTWADAVTIASSGGFANDFHIINGSTITLIDDIDNFSLFGNNWTLVLEGYSVNGAYFYGGHASGTCTAATEVHFDHFNIGTMSVQKGHFDFCTFGATLTMTLAGAYFYHDCKSGVPGPNGPTFAKTAGQTITSQWRNWPGSMNLTGLEVGDTLTIGGDELGTIDLGSPAGAVVVEIRGIYKEVVNIGSAAVNLDGAINAADVALILATVDHTTYGLAKLVRATTPANTLDVSANGEAGLDFDNTSGTLAAAQFANDMFDQIAQSLNGVVWYVDKTGNDGNTGQSFGTGRAFLTVAAAVAAASAGDRIEVGPGTFTEQVDLSALAGITLRGAGTGATTITTAAGNCLTVGNDGLVEFITIETTAVAGRACLISGKTGVVLRDAEFFGVDDGVYCTSAEVRAERIRADSQYDGMVVVDSRFAISDSFLTSSAAVDGVLSGALGVNNSSGTVDNCTLQVLQTTVETGSTFGIWVSTTDVPVVVSNTTIISIIENAGSSGNVWGVHFSAAPAGGGSLLLDGCAIEVRNAGSGTATDLERLDYGVLAVYNSRYNRDNTIGTITDIDNDIVTDTGEIGTAGAGLTDVTVSGATAGFFEDHFTVDSGKVSGEEVSGSVILEIAKINQDRLLTGATHNIPNSAGRILRESAETAIITSGTAQGPGANDNQIQLASGASSMDGAYDPAMVVLVGGTGEGQTRLSLEYNGDSRTMTVDRTWKVNPVAADTEYIVVPHPGREHVNEGLARGGGNNTIILNDLASSNDNAYHGQTVFLRSGLGEDQSRLVLTSDGDTKECVVDRDWDINPDDTTGYVMLALGNVRVAVNADKTGYALSSAEDVYHADIDVSIDGANSQDEYTITWFKNGVRVTSGITLPTIQVIKRANGTDLIAETTPTEIGSTGSFKEDEASARITAGEAVVVVVGATIDGAPRTFARVVSRDSS